MAHQVTLARHDLATVRWRIRLAADAAEIPPDTARLLLAQADELDQALRAQERDDEGEP